MSNSKTAEIKMHCERFEEDCSECDEEELLKKKKRVSFNNTIQTRKFYKTSIIESPKISESEETREGSSTLD